MKLHSLQDYKANTLFKELFAHSFRNLNYEQNIPHHWLGTECFMLCSK